MAGIAQTATLLQLTTVASIPVEHFADSKNWDSEIDVIPEFSFAIEAQSDALVMCAEHRGYEWLEYDDALRRVAWDSNRTALWELYRRLKRAQREQDL